MCYTVFILIAITLRFSLHSGAKYPLIIGDMPFGSYEESIPQCIHNATRLIKESGVGAIKLEGGVRRQKEAYALSQCGIAVMGHIGLTPQSVGSLGGYKVQGKSCINWQWNE